VSASLSDDVRRGLRGARKWLNPALFYDARGSELFEKITALPEYYQTRTERALLAKHAAQIASLCRETTTVVEFGSGSSEKTEVLLSELIDQGREVRYLPVDISRSALVDAAERLSERLDELEIHAIVGEYSEAAAAIPERARGGRLAVFLGSSLGNFAPAEARNFLRDVRRAVGDEGQLLIGLDLVKEVETLERAYDDRRGVTADFNKNILRHLNRAFDADFDVDDFAHHAVWNEEKERIEMHLESLKEQTVEIGALDLTVELEDGEKIHTESSHKYTPESIRELAAATGWRVARSWTDPEQLFSLNLFAARGAERDDA
jgi:L-histidine N-alpha-methyltransferase